MSSANACFSVSSVIALPPYFTTMTFPWYFFSHGKAMASVAAWSVAFFHSSGCHSWSGVAASPAASDPTSAVMPNPP